MYMYMYVYTYIGKKWFISVCTMYMYLYIGFSGCHYHHTCTV